MASVHSSLKGLVVAGLIAGLGHAALAQNAPPPPPPAGAGMAHHDGAKMHEQMAKRAAQLKAELKLTPAQEGAWTTFTTSMQPPPRGPRPDRAEFDKLTTPERIDKMRAMRAERDTAADKRGDAAKAFYAVLTPEQQKVFDAKSLHHFGPHGGPGGHHRGGPDGQPSKG